MRKYEYTEYVTISSLEELEENAFDLDFEMILPKLLYIIRTEMIDQYNRTGSNFEIKFQLPQNAPASILSVENRHKLLRGLENVLYRIFTNSECKCFSEIGTGPGFMQEITISHRYRNK